MKIGIRDTDGRGMEDPGRERGRITRSWWGSRRWMRRTNGKREWRDEGVRKLGKDEKQAKEMKVRKRERERSHTVGAGSHRRRLIEGERTIFERSDRKG